MTINNLYSSFFKTETTKVPNITFLPLNSFILRLSGKGDNSYVITIYFCDQKAAENK